jgi:hypothetical protein
VAARAVLREIDPVLHASPIPFTIVIIFKMYIKRCRGVAFMQIKELTTVLLAVFIIVANDNGLFGYDEDLSKSQIQRDRQNNAEPGQAASDDSVQTSAYPPYPSQNQE